jgi:hypothetical protein
VTQNQQTEQCEVPTGIEQSVEDIGGHSNTEATEVLTDGRQTVEVSSGRNVTSSKYGTV